MDRRQFLSASSAALSFAFVSGAGSSPALALVQGEAGDAALNALFEKIFQDRVHRFPELATSLGLDKGENAHLKSELDVRPTGSRACRGPRQAAFGACVPAGRANGGPQPGRAAQSRCHRLPDRNEHHPRREVRHRQRPTALSDLPAGRLLLLHSGFPQHGPHDRHGGRCRGLSRPSGACRKVTRQRHRRAARPGRSRLPGPGLVDRPDARSDAQAPLAGA